MILTEYICVWDVSRISFFSWNSQWIYLSSAAPAALYLPLVVWTQKVTFETCDKKTKKQKDKKTINQKGKKAKQEFYILMSGAVLHSWGVLGYEQHFYFFPKPDSQWTHFYPYIKSLSLCSMYSVQNIPCKSLFDLKNMLQYSFYKYKEKKMG